MPVGFYWIRVPKKKTVAAIKKGRRLKPSPFPLKAKLTYMKRLHVYAILPILGALVWLSLACSKKESPNPSPPADSTSTGTTDTIAYIDTLPDSAPFVHEGLLLSQADFDRIIAKVNAGTEPWLSGWNKLIANAHAQLSYSPSPVAKLVRGGNSREEPDPDNYSHAFNDAAAAFQMAIRWRVTGDTAYAQKAVQILNAWADICKLISGDSNKALAAGIYGYQFAIAGELLRGYSGWTAADFSTYQQWMLDVFYSVNEAFLTTHWGTCISHYWANWDLANLASVMAIGVLTDKRVLYNEAVNYLQRGTGNGNILKAINNVYDDQGLAQLQESGRDQGHATLCIALLGEICQMAWTQGDDFYGFDHNRFLKACEYTAKYNVANLSVPFTPYTNCEGVAHTVISANGRGTVRPMWELPYNHYVKLKGLTATYTTMAVGTVRPEGGGGDYGPNSGGYDQLGFGTLLYTQE